MNGQCFGAAGRANRPTSTRRAGGIKEPYPSSATFRPSTWSRSTGQLWTCTAPTGFELATQTGLALSTGVSGVAVLAAFDLVASRGGRWHVVATTSLAVLAEMLGCTEVILARLEMHRAERAAYRQVLRIVTPLNTGHTSGGVWTGPPPEGQTVLEILERILGGQRIA